MFAETAVTGVETVGKFVVIRLRIREQIRYLRCFGPVLKRRVWTQVFILYMIN